MTTVLADFETAVDRFSSSVDSISSALEPIAAAMAGVERMTDELERTARAQAESQIKPGGLDLGDLAKKSPEEMLKSIESIDSAQERAALSSISMMDNLDKFKFVPLLALLRGGRLFDDIGNRFEHMGRTVSHVARDVHGGLESIGSAAIGAGKEVTRAAITMYEENQSLFTTAANLHRKLVEDVRGFRTNFGDLTTGIGRQARSVAEDMQLTFLDYRFSKALDGIGERMQSAFGFGVAGSTAALGTLETALEGLRLPLQLTGQEIDDSMAQMVTVFAKGTGISAEELRTLGRIAAAEGVSITDMLTEIAVGSSGMGRAFGVSEVAVRKGAISMMNNLKLYGGKSAEEIIGIETRLQTMGTTAAETGGMMETFFSLEGAVEAASKLAAIGINIDPIAMLEAEDPAEQIMLLGKAAARSGVDFGNLGRHRLHIAATSLGLSDVITKELTLMAQQGRSIDEIRERQEELAAQEPPSLEEGMQSMLDVIPELIREFSNVGEQMLQFQLIAQDMGHLIDTPEKMREFFATAADLGVQSAINLQQLSDVIKDIGLESDLGIGLSAQQLASLSASRSEYLTTAATDLQKVQQAALEVMGVDTVSEALEKDSRTFLNTLDEMSQKMQKQTYDDFKNEIRTRLVRDAAAGMEVVAKQSGEQAAKFYGINLDAFHGKIESVGGAVKSAFDVGSLDFFSEGTKEIKKMIPKLDDLEDSFKDLGRVGMESLKPLLDAMSELTKDTTTGGGAIGVMGDLTTTLGKLTETLGKEPKPLSFKAEIPVHIHIAGKDLKHTVRTVLKESDVAIVEGSGGVP